MILLFRKFTPFNLFLLFVVGFALSIVAYFKLPEESYHLHFEPAVTNLLAPDLIPRLSPVLNLLLSLLITVLQGIWLNLVADKYNLLGRPSLLPALMYVMLGSMFISFLALNPVIICNFLLIWMIDKLLKIYHVPNVKPLLFDLGILVAVGTLFYFPFIVMFPVLWAALVLFRPFDWREWLSGVFGFGCVYFILGMIYFWLERMPDFYHIWTPLKPIIPVVTPLDIDLKDYFILIPLGIILLFFLNALRENFFKSIVHVRKVFRLLLLVLFLAILSFWMNNPVLEYHFVLCAIPMAVYAAYYFNYATKTWVYESLFWMLFLSILFFQWY